VVSFLLGAAVTASIYAILSVSLNLQAGVTGLMNFGVVAFFCVGAYASALGGVHGVPWPLAMLIGMAVAALLGVACGAIARTLAAVYLGLATLAMAELVHLLVLNGDWSHGARGISDVAPFFGGLSGNAFEAAWLALGLGVLAICAFVAWRITESQAGRVLRMVREQEDLAASLGHDVTGAKIRIFALSAPMAAVAGSLYAHYITYIGPEQFLAFTTFVVWTMLVVGGMGSLRGAICGAFLVELLYEVTRFGNDVIDISPATLAGLRILVVGVALFGFIVFCPGGLLPERLRRIHA
jgi:branched-chain amino acid transport system permease protein